MLEEIINLYDDGFDNAVIGIDTLEMRLIYSVTKCLDILITSGMTSDEALEFFEFNVSSAYMGEKTPIWCYDIF